MKRVKPNKGAAVKSIHNNLVPQLPDIAWVEYAKNPNRNSRDKLKNRVKQQKKLTNVG